MPYINDADRPSIDVLIAPLVERLAADGFSEGELNYAISKLIHEWILAQPKGLRYAAVCVADGTLGCVAKEFYRVVAGPYEDTKIDANGPVSRLDEPKLV